MGIIEEYAQKVAADEMGENIEKEFKRYGAKIEVGKKIFLPDKIMFSIKTKGNTRISKLYDLVSEVQRKLKLPVFSLVNKDFQYYIVASDKRIENDHLPINLSKKNVIEKMSQMKLPYLVGHNVLGEMIFVDVSKEPHMLIGGSTNSGKTVGLKSLVASIIYSKSPSEVNIIMIDVGTGDLVLFNKIPHLSCPVIRDRAVACHVLIALEKEMESRIELQITHNKKFLHLPSLMLLIDEFPALFMGIDDKYLLKRMLNAVSGLLQRGRHAKIHLVLAAQNPTMQNMKVDLGNITARIAYRCAKKNFSETILGEGGAERLLEQGDMLFKSSQFNGLQRIRGSFISPKELKIIIFFAERKWMNISADNKFTLNIDTLNQQIYSEYMNVLSGKYVTIKADNDDTLLIKIILWALVQKSISCNMISENFNVGWRRANGFMKQLHDLGLVGGLDAKLPRRVLPQSIEEVSEKVLDILQSNGVPLEDISKIMNEK